MEDDLIIKSQLITKKLQELYPNATCSLNYSSPIELLIAVRLSAQCTDKKVNEITPELFKKFKSTKDFANADPNEIAKYIHSCGFFKVKSNDIVNMCKKIFYDFDNKIPESMESLTSLPGVGRKTANLVLGILYGAPGIVVDTHLIRVTKRLGFHDEANPEKIEKIMLKFIPQEISQKFCHQVVMHGRSICKAVKPKCGECTFNKICKYCQKIAAKN